MNDSMALSGYREAKNYLHQSCSYYLLQDGDPLVGWAIGHRNLSISIIGQTSRQYAECLAGAQRLLRVHRGEVQAFRCLERATRPANTVNSTIQGISDQ